MRLRVIAAALTLRQGKLPEFNEAGGRDRDRQGLSVFEVDSGLTWCPPADEHSDRGYVEILRGALRRQHHHIIGIH